MKFAHRNNVKNIVFTSSAAVYGGPDVDVISERQALRPLNTYGETKVAAESLFERASRQESISAVSLRTFNMGGANNNNYFDKRGENVIPKILNSVFGGTSFKIYGNTYPTYDGTCVRDYIHVSDVAKAHIAAMKYLSANSLGTYSALNVSSNKGTSVIELFQKINEISGRKGSFQFADRRPGDPAYSVGSNEAAIKLLKWEPTKSLNQILIESIRAYA